MQDALSGGFADPARDAARVFRAVLDAMARPGTVARAVAEAPAPLGPAAAALALTLMDADTPVWLAQELDPAKLRRWLAFHTGAPMVEQPGEAAFGFTRIETLPPLENFAAGTPAYPDRSATLVVEVANLTDGPPLRLTGAGIAGTAKLRLGANGSAIAPALAANHARFPLGVDWVFTCGDRLAAVPRSTAVEV